MKVWCAIGAAGLSAWFVGMAHTPAQRVPPPEHASRAQAPARRAAPAPLTSVASERQIEGTWRRPPPLSEARGWAASLEALYRLGPEKDPARRLRFLNLLYSRAEGVARQNLIFHVALSLPWEVAEPWLSERWADDPSSSPADRLDLEAALAMSGEPEALRSYVARAERGECGPPPPLVDTLEDHERLCLAGGRERLRAYRALEVVDRVAYFKRTAVYVHVAWLPHPRAARGEARLCQLQVQAERTAPPRLRQRLLRAWVAKNQRHPGADDVALRIARFHRSRGDLPRAARWYARATLLPDQDVTGGALGSLLGIAELRLNASELDDLVAWAEETRHSPELLRYVRLRRIAASQGVAAGCAAAEELAERRPRSLVARAWRARWAEPPARGLSSGVAPISTADPLQRVRGERISAAHAAEVDARGVPELLGNPGQGTQLGRSDPWREALALSPRWLARQLRLWSTLAELERRSGPDAIYARGALFYAEPLALFPIYSSRSKQGVFHLPWDSGATWQAAKTRFEAQSRSLLRAVVLFSELSERHPTWEGHDRALFSEGLAWRQLLQHEGWESYEDRQVAIRSLVATFERLQREHPESPYCDDAWRAAAYWRLHYAGAFSE